MRVVFIASVYRHIVAFHIPFIRLFQQRGYEVWTFANGNLEDKRVLEESGVRCVDISIQRNPFTWGSFRSYREIKNLLDKNKFDLIHVHTPTAAFLTRLAFWKINHGKLLYTAHGFHFYKGSPILNWLIYYYLEKLAQRWTDGILVMNSEDYDNAIKMGYPKEKVYYVHGVGVDIPNEENLDEMIITEIKKELGIPRNSIIISYVAELNKNKNHQFLLRNWEQIMDNHPNVFLLIIGSGRTEKELKRYAAQHLTNIKFLGYRNDIPRILKATDVLSLLSIREGLPRSVMEAMANGIPCVVTNTRGLRDLVIDGKNGYVINNGDDKKLQQAFIKLIGNEKNRQDLGKGGLQLIQPYNLNNVLREYEKIYDNFI